MSGTRYGIRKIEDIEGGVIAWLHPGGADLDDVLVEIARYQASEDHIEWWDMRPVAVEGPSLPLPDGDYLSNPAAWQAYWDHRPRYMSRLGDEFPTRLSIQPDVGYYRRMPWCHCGNDEHTWHFEAANPGPGASLAVLVSSW